MEKYDEHEVGNIYKAAGVAMCKLINGEKISEKEKGCIEKYRQMHKLYKSEIRPKKN